MIDTNIILSKTHDRHSDTPLLDALNDANPDALHREWLEDNEPWRLNRAPQSLIEIRDTGRRDVIRKCSKCGRTGHNISTCCE